jgi:hypothetical protein
MKLIWRMEIEDGIWRISLEIASGVCWNATTGERAPVV